MRVGISCLIIAIFSMAGWSEWALAQPSVSRSYSEMTLGMGVEEIEEIHAIEEVPGSKLLPGESRFRIKGEFSGINEILCTFYLGKLFRIEILYSLQYSQQLPWERFVQFLEKGHGEGWSFESPQGQVAIWDDGETSFILERKVASGSPPSYTVSILDNGLYNAREESCPERKFDV